MSIALMSTAWQLDLPPLDKFLLIALADHANDEGIVSSSLGWIAWKCGISRDTVRRWRDRLIALELIEILELGDGRGKWTVYKLHLEKGSILAPLSIEKGGTSATLSSHERAASGDKKGSTVATLFGVKGSTLSNTSRKKEEDGVARSGRPDGIAPSARSKEPSLVSLARVRKNTNPRAWPEDLVFDLELRAYALEKGVKEPEKEWEHFENYHRSKGNKYLDWKRAWYTWVRRCENFTGGSHGYPVHEKREFEFIEDRRTRENAEIIRRAFEKYTH